MRRLVPAVIPLAGIGMFWLLSNSVVPVPVFWVVVAGCGGVGLLAAFAGLIAGATAPRSTALLLRGWSLFVFIVSALFAAGCLYLAYKIGGHVGSANLARAKVIATGLGAVIGAAAVILYNAVPGIGYGWFARMTITFRYESVFPAKSDRVDDDGFLAGRSAVTDPGGGSVPFPANWQVRGSNPHDEKPELRTIVIDGWRAVAVRRRLTLIKLAMPPPAGSPPVAARPALSAQHQGSPDGSPSPVTPPGEKAAASP
jgi:hypothetical protein